MTAAARKRLRGMGWALALATLQCAVCAAALPSARMPIVTLPRMGLTPRDLAVIVNETDPLSTRIGEYYRERRGIPAENLIRVRFDTKTVMPAATFARVKAEIDARIPAHVQALALAWTEPFRVECMSVTSAFAYGFDPAYCAKGCRMTPYSRYFNSDSHTPYTDFGIRPAMLIAATTFEQARALIDRGVSADATAPRAGAYLLETSDKARNARASSFSSAQLLANDHLEVHVLKADTLQDRNDILFYFTGLRHIDDLETNRFIPGAIADHLTSSGGVLNGTSQMSSLRWLEAGATGSYGTVVEPCNFTAKFPSVPIAMRRYLAGETLIEAYWKSVATPSQGVFVGEPLAAPYGGYRLVFDGRDLLVRTGALAEGRYSIVAADSVVGPFDVVARGVTVRGGVQQIRIREARRAVYELRRE